MSGARPVVIASTVDALRDLLFWAAVLLLAVVVLVLLHRVFGASASTQRALAERDAVDRLQITPADRAAWVSALRGRDPGFNVEGFLNRVRTLFLATQQAWSNGDLQPVRPFLSDATWLRFRVQLGLLRAQGVRNLTADMAVTGLELLGLEQNAWFDTLHVLIHARTRDADVPVGRSEAEARAVASRAPAEPFTEVWSLVRKPGVQTAKGVLAERACPSCGAPFEGGSSSTCPYCKAVVNSGGYDWVLAEITQTVEVTRADAPVPGLEAVRQADPGLSLEVLEDRASLIFWRWIEAQSTQQPERLARLAQSNLMARLRTDLLRLSEQHARRVFLECAVGEVRVRTFEEGPENQVRANIEVRWSARTGVGPIGQAPPTLPVLPQRSVFTLCRKRDAVSKVDQGMSTERCPECGGPLGDALEPTCQWCSTLLAGDLRDWTLAEVCSFEAWEGRRAVPGANLTPAESEPSAVTLNVEERERLLYTMAAMAMADGAVDARERRMLVQCAERWGLPPEQVDVALSAGPTSLEVLLPDTHAGEPLLRTLAQLARVDGRVDAAERRMLESVAARLGLSQRLPAVLTSIGAR
jgi:tellurite resistance protein